MINHAIASERQFADHKAREFQSKGYDVQRAQRLDFLPGFVADLVVSIGDETKVIEVRSRSNLGSIVGLDELARILESKPGWSFELLLVGEPEVLEAPDEIQSYQPTDVDQLVFNAETVLEQGFPEAAFLLAWSAGEAKIREMIWQHGTAIDVITTPWFLLDKAMSEAVVSREEYHRFIDFMKYRNALVHGFKTPAFDHAIVADLIQSVRDLHAQ